VTRDNAWNGPCRQAHHLNSLSKASEQISIEQRDHEDNSDDRRERCRHRRNRRNDQEWLSEK